MRGWEKMGKWIQWNQTRQMWKMDGNRKDWKGRRKSFFILLYKYYDSGWGGESCRRWRGESESEMMKGVCCSCSRQGRAGQGRAGDFWVILCCDGWGDIHRWMVDEMGGIESRWMEIVIGVWAVDLRCFLCHIRFGWLWSPWSGIWSGRRRTGVIAWRVIGAAGSMRRCAQRVVMSGQRI